MDKIFFEEISHSLTNMSSEGKQKLNNTFIQSLEISSA